MTETEKTCRTCGETAPACGFYAGRGSCKDCVRARVRAHRDANLDAARDREREAARRKDHRAARRRWIEAHPEKVAAARRKWKAENPEKLAQYEAERRARRAGSSVTRTSYAAVREAHTACYLCGEPLAGRVVHVDHVVPLAAGGPVILAAGCLALAVAGSVQVGVAVGADAGPHAVLAGPPPGVELAGGKGLAAGPARLLGFCHEVTLSRQRRRC
jgi:hypothetical protein